MAAEFSARFSAFPLGTAAAETTKAAASATRTMLDLNQSQT
jgi:hypothetical protein